MGFFAGKTCWLINFEIRENKKDCAYYIAKIPCISILGRIEEVLSRNSEYTQGLKERREGGVNYSQAMSREIGREGYIE